MQEAQVLGSDSDSDDSGPVFGGRSDDEGAPALFIFVWEGVCFVMSINVWSGPPSACAQGAWCYSYVVI